MAEPVLELVGVRKTYGVGTPIATEVLHGIDLRLDTGEFVALIGPSGSGKSTLLNIVGLLDRPTSGRLSVIGEDTGRLDEARLTALRGQALGFVFQAHFLLSAFSAVENVMLPLLLRPGRAAGARQIAVALLERVGLERFIDSAVGNMSGGQQQRVAIARALALSPPLVLADEPTGNLDSKSAESVFDLLREINRERGTTFLMVTHNLAMAHRCDRTIELVDGLLVAPSREVVVAS